MKAEELRIGNFIYSSGNVMQVHSIDKDGFYGQLLSPKLEPDYLKGLEPIPITEEWLLKFGFSAHYEVGLKHYSIGEFIFVFQNGIITKYKHVKYVHQLQNIYFALTNEELILK